MFFSGTVNVNEKKEMEEGIKYPREFEEMQLTISKTNYIKAE